MIEYGYRKKGSAMHYKFKRIDTFVLTNDIEMIKRDANVNAKIISQLKSGNKEMDIMFKSIYVEGQYGNTNY
tara:strand:- start:111 stop:326 length:216 start_codon:yes stop_codon:yes gene_type:complete